MVSSYGTLKAFPAQNECVISFELLQMMDDRFLLGSAHGITCGNSQGFFGGFHPKGDLFSSFFSTEPKHSIGSKLAHVLENRCSVGMFC
jgi:hypothetical protein